MTIFLMGQNRWIDETSWPPEGTEQRDYYLMGGGAANSINGDGRLIVEPPARERPDVYTYDPLFPVPSAGGHSGFVPVVASMGPADQAGVEILNGVLVYTSAPLEEDLTVIGPVSVILYAATSAPDTDFTSKLCVVSPEGRSTNIQEGIIRARHRQSSTDPRPIMPDEVYEYRIDLALPPTSSRPAIVFVYRSLAAISPSGIGTSTSVVHSALKVSRTRELRPKPSCTTPTIPPA